MKIKGLYIKQVMREKGLTQREVAKKLGISYSALSQALNYCAMHETTLIRLAEILKIPPAELSMLEKSDDQEISKNVTQAGEALSKLVAQIDLANKYIVSLTERMTEVEHEVRGIKEKFKLLGQ